VAGVHERLQVAESSAERLGAEMAADADDGDSGHFSGTYVGFWLDPWDFS